MPRSRFILPVRSAMLLVVAFGSIGLGPKPTVAANEPIATAAASDGPCEVTALFSVSSDQPSLLLEANRRPDWQLLSNTQLAYLKSYFVLKAALRAEGIQSLPLIQSQPDPVAWLRSQLNVGFQQNSEIMYVAMRGDSADRDQLRAIVNAVSEAYLKEVVFEDEQRRLVVRDALARSFQQLSDEIRSKMDVQNALANDLGFADQDGKSRVMQDLDLKRLERIETELLRLENEQLSAQVYSDQEGGKISPKERAQLTFYGQRIEELRKRQAELEARIVSRNQSSVELEIGAEELKQLQKIAAEMSLKLEQLNIEAVGPDRVRLIQEAN